MYRDKDKEIRRKKAIEHTELMEEKYHKEIQYSIQNTKEYSSIDNPNNKGITTNIQVIENDTVSALFDLYKNNSNKKYIVLNFASYTSPGGGFIRGSSAQEECLCMESFLYNVLKAQEDFYSWNKEHMNNCLYTDRGLYSKDIYFFKDNQVVKADVLTVASPNKRRFVENKNYSLDDNDNALENRIRFLLNIAQENSDENTILILGAFGCGAFRQDPEVVSKLFKQYLVNGKYNFQEVIFAVTSGHNYDVFEKEFN